MSGAVEQLQWVDNVAVGLRGRYQVRQADDGWVIDFQPSGQLDWTYSSYDSYEDAQSAKVTAAEWDTRGD
ncbi:MAG: hypothetical protein PHQ28_00390 [Mycobacterium sp.]|nr:hypothetical protein [Mycobacterium sp.]